ncbi:hypothetical protein IFM89_018765 [Coptis chinensis]|uniref:Uncharacterized protein n=1 Tax=Coptis chinensis TaxID=261450 RepID=A0A835HN19_9MAGN|nr:hypothetical protein IFM89_018765 [Coptis chinensis]
MEDNTEETMRDSVEMIQYFPRTVSSQIISEVSTVNVEPISFSMEEVLQDVPNESLQHNEPIDVDLTMEFSTNMVFESRNDLITWARNTGKKIGCIIVIKRSDYAHPGRTPRLLLACERYGKFQPQKKPNQTEEEANKSSEVQGDNNKKRKRKSGTKSAPNKPKLKVTRAKIAPSMQSTSAMTFISSFLDEIKALIADVQDISLDANKQFYTIIFENEEEYKRAYDMIDCDKSPCDSENWMNMAYAGPQVASCYNVVIVLLSQDGWYTCLPLKSPPPPKTAPTVIAVAYVNKCHFMHAILKPNCPLPPIFATWKNYAQDCAIAWRTRFEARFAAFDKIMPVTKIHIVLDK